MPPLALSCPTGPACADADPADDFLRLARRHQPSAFEISFGLLHDERAAETITRQVFIRVRRRLAAGVDPASATLWIYHASLRFACRYYWKTIPPAVHRRLGHNVRGHSEDFKLREFVHVLAHHPGKIAARDCELVSLRHVLGLSLIQIGRLLRMHPYEISNRLAWSCERVKKICGTAPRPAVFDPQRA